VKECSLRGIEITKGRGFFWRPGGNRAAGKGETWRGKKASNVATLQSCLAFVLGGSIHVTELIMKLGKSSSSAKKHEREGIRYVRRGRCIGTNFKREKYYQSMTSRSERSSLQRREPINKLKGLSFMGGGVLGRRGFGVVEGQGAQIIGGAKKKSYKHKNIKGCSTNKRKEMSKHERRKTYASLRETLAGG